MSTHSHACATNCNLPRHAQDVQAHSRLVSLASRVVATMLAAPMAEAQTRRIEVADCTKDAVLLFLDLLYTGTTTTDPGASVLLTALVLAHRWDVLGVVSMLEVALIDKITDATFVDVATNAVYLDLERLKNACITFSKTSGAVEKMLAQGTLAPGVVALLTGQQPSTAPPAKRRKAF